MTVNIRTNASQVSLVLIADMGVVILGSGGSEDFTTASELQDIQQSSNLLTLCTDDAYGADSSTLILNDGSTDVAQADVPEFLANLNAVTSSAGKTDYPLSSSFAVPAGSPGLVYLSSNGVNTLDVPLKVNRAALLTGATFSVNKIDPTQTYDLEILINDVVSRTLTLPPNTLSVQVDTFSDQVNPSDEITARVVRTGGVLKSVFSEIRGSIEIASDLVGGAPSTPTDTPDISSRDGTNRKLVYIGRSETDGAATSDPVWQIYRIDMSQNPLPSKAYADGDTNFDNIWDNRESLTYAEL